MSDYDTFDRLIAFIRDRFATDQRIPLHAPHFNGREQAYVAETIESTFVSSVGPFVDRFERDMEQFTNSPRAVATVNGTAALHIALLLAGVKKNDYVLTQPLTFVATCNAIVYCGAEPIFTDVDRHTLGLSPVALESWLHDHAFIDDDGVCRTGDDRRIIRACVPMHTFGHPCDLKGLTDVCSRWNIVLVEDAAESLGSLYNGKHTGTFGLLGTLSFNGNKIITTGGGGMILTNCNLGERAKHLTTTAKAPHSYLYIHTETGFNYRLPNINAALGCAQMKQLDYFLAAKRILARDYKTFFSTTDLTFVTEPDGCRSNYWLNAVICHDEHERDALLDATNAAGVMTRPAWQLMHHLPMFAQCRRGKVSTAEWLESRIVNLPSSVPEEPMT
jgi:aminotransferase in exopolysaccharide biosynthesis